MNHVGGLIGWSWIFIFEGIVTVIFAFWGMVGLPQDAVFLTEKERKQVILRLEIDREGQNIHYDPKFVKQGLKDWKLYLYAVIYLGYVAPLFDSFSTILTHVRRINAQAIALLCTRSRFSCHLLLRAWVARTRTLNYS
jgi:hypothetical protein